jgi:hypothetical protein
VGSPILAAAAAAFGHPFKSPQQQHPPMAHFYFFTPAALTSSTLSYCMQKRKKGEKRK